MKYQLTCSLVAALCAPALAQSTLTAVHVVSDPAYEAVEPLHVGSHPSGGVVALFNITRPSAPHRNIALTRIDERGDRLWQTERPIPSLAGLQTSFQDAVVTARGATLTVVTAIGIAGTSYSRLSSFDSNGQLEWERDLTSGWVGLNVPYLIADLGSDSAGNVYVAGVVDSQLIAPFTGHLSVRLLRGTDGAELWRHERPAVASGPKRMLAAFRGDRATLVYTGPAGITAEAIGPNGAVLFSTTGLQPALTSPIPSFLAVSDGGEVAFGHWQAYVSQTNEVVSLDGAGNVVWRTSVPSTWGLVDGTFTSSGDLVLIEGNAFGHLATRFDAAGNVRWQHPGSASLRSYQHVFADDSDGVVIAGYDNVTPYPYTAAMLEFVDRQGVTLGVEAFTSSGATEGIAARPARDARGNLWVATGRYAPVVNTGFPIVGATLRVVPGNDPSTVGCAAQTANSTGSLSRLRAAGSGSVNLDNVTLVADQLPPQAAVMFLNARAAGFTPNPGGSLGDLCLSGTIGRYARPSEVRTASATGLAALPLALASTPSGGAVISILAGETWYFQAWHRDVAAGQATSNFTGSISLVFQ